MQKVLGRAVRFIYSGDTWSAIILVAKDSVLLVKFRFVFKFNVCVMEIVNAVTVKLCCSNYL